MQNDVYARTLARAAQIVGGLDLLAIDLGVPPGTLAIWLRHGNPPLEIFLRAVDIVVARDVLPESLVGHQASQASEPSR